MSILKKLFALVLSGIAGILLSACATVDPVSPPDTAPSREAPDLPPSESQTLPVCPGGDTCRCTPNLPEPEPPPPPPNFWGIYRSREFQNYRLVLDETENTGKLTRGRPPSEEIVDSGIVFLSPDADGNSCLVDLRIPELNKYNKKQIKILRSGENSFEILYNYDTIKQHSLGKNFTREQ